ncbi:hypothetical protein M5689_021333 [Euphorbia peplus]|nr:hypothetical protein M5689_021333 [Euphorbia peplus]
MGHPIPNLTLIFPASMSLIFFCLALATLLKSHEPTIITQMGFGSIILLSPLVTLSVLALRLSFPKLLNNLDLGVGAKMCLQVPYELVSLIGSIIALGNSQLREWDLIWASYFISFHFVASYFVTGLRLNFAATVVGGMMFYSSSKFGEDTYSRDNVVVVGLMFVVVLVGVQFTNFATHLAPLRNVKMPEESKEVKISENGVKV